MYNFLPHTDKTRNGMLSDIGLSSAEDLFKNINHKIRLTDDFQTIPDALSELEVKEKLQDLAGKNLSKCSSFLGGGTYNRYIPSCISTIIERSEFLTSYTPYQPEVSQGTLQVIYEYQSMICSLTGMDVANASVYDGASACAEALLMASRITGKDKALVASTLNPQYKEVIDTYCYGEGIEIDIPSFNQGKIDIEKLEDKIIRKICSGVNTKSKLSWLRGKMCLKFPNWPKNRSKIYCLR